jgi:hypothetical protein
VQLACNTVSRAMCMQSTEGNRMLLGIVLLVRTPDTVDRRAALSLGIQRTIGGWR